MSKPLRWFFLLTWLAILGVFVYQSIVQKSVPPGLDAAFAAADLEAGEQEWYGIYMNQPDKQRVKIGYAAVTHEVTPTGFKTTSITYMRISAMGTVMTMRTEGVYLTDPQYRLQYVDFLTNSDRMKFRVTGKVKDHRIYLDIETAAGKQQQELDFPELPVISDDIVSLLADQGGLKVGNSVDLPFFDPMTRRYEKIKVRVAGRIEHTMPDGRLINGYRLETEMLGVTAVTIIDEKGNTLEETSMNITMLRETREAVMTENWEEQPVDLPELARVRIDREIPNPHNTTLLKVRIMGVTLQGLPLDDHRQTFADQILTVQVPIPPSQGSFTVPYAGDDPDLKALLQAEPLIESNDPAIIEQAQAIVKPGDDAVVAAKALTQWVFKNLEKEALFSMTSAKDVLELRRGDCNEHASLFTALARAAGLPARTEVGLVYHQGAFYYHAWNSVYVGEWVTIDTTTGSFPADATHLRLVTGGLDKQVDMVRVMGKISLELVEAK